MEIRGLPAHALLVHLVVVLLSLTAAVAALGSVSPAVQRKLTFLTPLWLYLRGGRPKRGISAALAVFVVASAPGTAVLVFLTGECGAQAVWGQL